MDKLQLLPVKQEFGNKKIEDIPKVISRELSAVGIDKIIKPGMRVGITVGSRGIRNIRTIIQRIILEVKERKVDVETFETYFTPNEQKILNFIIKKGPSTYSQIALGTKIKRTNIKRIVQGLKKKNGIKLDGRTDQGYMWGLSPHAKRMNVKI